MQSQDSKRELRKAATANENAIIVAPIRKDISDKKKVKQFVQSHFDIFGSCSNI